MKSVVNQVAKHSLPSRLYSPGHEFLTYPIKRVAYLGISNYAKKCIVPEIIRIRVNDNPAVRESIMFFQGSLLSTREDPVGLFEHIPNKLIIRKNEILMVVQTKDSDVSVLAPVDLRVIRINPPVMVDFFPKTAFEWLMQVEVVDEKQTEGLLTEEEYVKLWKTVEYE